MKNPWVESPLNILFWPESCIFLQVDRTVCIAGVAEITRSELEVTILRRGYLGNLFFGIIHLCGVLCVLEWCCLAVGNHWVYFDEIWAASLKLKPGGPTQASGPVFFFFFFFIPFNVLY